MKNILLFFILLQIYSVANDFKIVSLKNHLDSTSYTTINNKNPLIIGFDKKNNEIGIGIKFKNNSKILISNKEGMFGNIYSDNIFKDKKTFYLSYLKNSEKINLSLTTGLFEFKNENVYNKLIIVSSNIKYNVLNEKNITMDVSLNLPTQLVKTTESISDNYKGVQASFDTKLSIKLFNDFYIKGFYKYNSINGNKINTKMKFIF